MIEYFFSRKIGKAYYPQNGEFYCYGSLDGRGLKPYVCTFSYYINTKNCCPEIVQRYNLYHFNVNMTIRTWSF